MATGGRQHVEATGFVKVEGEAATALRGGEAESGLRSRMALRCCEPVPLHGVRLRPRHAKATKVGLAE